MLDSVSVKITSLFAKPSLYPNCAGLSAKVFSCLLRRGVWLLLLLFCSKHALAERPTLPSFACPKDELEASCQALVRLYRSSSAWPQGFKTSWLTSPQICNWKGVTCNLEQTQVIELDLVSANLTKLKPHAFQALYALTWLSLGNNQLEELPDGLFTGLSALKTLDLTGNRLKTLTQGVFADLSSLQTLFLGGNSMTKLPKGVFADLSSLQRLYLSINQLKELQPGVFAGLSSLRVLWLDYNHLKKLPKGLFSNLSSLIWLNLDNNPLKTQLSQGLCQQLKKVSPVKLCDFPQK